SAVLAGRRRLPAGAVRRCHRRPPASGRRPHRPRDHPRAARGAGGRGGGDLRAHAAGRADRGGRTLRGRRRTGWRAPHDRRRHGALLVNAGGDRFVDELAARDVVTDAIVRECDQGRGLTTPDGRPAVLLDTTRIDPEVAAQVLPTMLRRYRSAGIDPLVEPIPTYPVLHY